MDLVVMLKECRSVRGRGTGGTRNVETLPVEMQRERVLSDGWPKVRWRASA